MSEPVQENPLSELLSSAIALHELFKSWLQAGFTETQAMQLCCAVLTSSAKKDIEEPPVD